MTIATTILGRLKVLHPNWKEGTANDSSLHSAVADCWERVSDHIGTRFFPITGLASGAYVDLDHNFKAPFSSLAFRLFTRNTSTGELTPITDATTPSLAQFAIAASSGNETTQVRITNNSGATRDLAVVLVQSVSEGQITATIDNNQSTASDIAGVKFASGRVRSAVLPFEIRRKTDSSELLEVGTIFLSWSVLTSSWRISVESKLDVSGVTFSVTSAGQLQYVSSNVSGTGYTGQIRIAGIRELLA
jgi:hypothetical protein